MGPVRERGLGLWDPLRQWSAPRALERASDGNRRDELHAQATGGGRERDTEAEGPQDLSPTPRSGGNHGGVAWVPGAWGWLHTDLA